MSGKCNGEDVGGGFATTNKFGNFSKDNASDGFAVTGIPSGKCNGEDVTGTKSGHDAECVGKASLDSQLEKLFLLPTFTIQISKVDNWRQELKIWCRHHLGFTDLPDVLLVEIAWWANYIHFTLDGYVEHSSVPSNIPISSHTTNVNSEINYIKRKWTIWLQFPSFDCSTMTLVQKPMHVGTISTDWMATDSMDCLDYQIRGEYLWLSFWSGWDVGINLYEWRFFPAFPNEYYSCPNEYYACPKGIRDSSSGSSTLTNEYRSLFMHDQQENQEPFPTPTEMRSVNTKDGFHVVWNNKLVKNFVPPHCWFGLIWKQKLHQLYRGDWLLLDYDNDLRQIHCSGSRQSFCQDDDYDDICIPFPDNVLRVTQVCIKGNRICIEGSFAKSFFRKLKYSPLSCFYWQHALNNLTLGCWVFDDFK